MPPCFGAAMGGDDAAPAGAPLWPMCGRAAAPAAWPKKAPERHVLVVDDQRVNRVVLAAQAQAIGYSVLVAAHGGEALELFAAHRGSLAAVLLDLQMPGMDGWDAALAMRGLEAATGAAATPAARRPAAGEGDECERPRQRRRSLLGAPCADAGGRRPPPVVIVACTACPLDGAVPLAAGGGGGRGRTVREHTLACGADAVVVKPIATAALRGVVEALLAARGGGGGEPAAAAASECREAGGGAPCEDAACEVAAGASGGGAAAKGTAGCAEAMAAAAPALARRAALAAPCPEGEGEPPALDAPRLSPLPCPCVLCP
ncbi:MAG: CheY-like superfamily [Monoraphidium minutum]|nr:MAG: CheY-like superfamily [Monoraphidium minutum]